MHANEERSETRSRRIQRFPLLANINKKKPRASKTYRLLYVILAVMFNLILRLETNEGLLLRFREERLSAKSTQQNSHTKQKKKNSPCFLLRFKTHSSSKLESIQYRDEEGGDEEQQQQTRKNNNNNNNADVGSREGVLLLVANLFVALCNVHVVRFL